MARGSLIVAAFVLLSSFLLGSCTADIQPQTAQPRTDPTIPPVAEETLPGTTASAIVRCTNDSLFLEDLSLPDGTAVRAGSELVKRWSVANEGTCDWDEGYRLVHVDGDGLLGPDAVALFPARAGSTAVWEVVFRAPDEPGTYRSVWQAQAPDGALFGEMVYISVVVGP
jgi:hypothetical protein